MNINIFTRCTKRNQFDILLTAVADVSKGQTDMTYQGEHQTLPKQSMIHQVCPSEACCTTIFIFEGHRFECVTLYLVILSHTCTIITTICLTHYDTICLTHLIDQRCRPRFYVLTSFHKCRHPQSLA